MHEIAQEKGTGIAVFTELKPTVMANVRRARERRMKEEDDAWGPLSVREKRERERTEEEGAGKVKWAGREFQPEGEIRFF